MISDMGTRSPTLHLLWVHRSQD